MKLVWICGLAMLMASPIAAAEIKPYPKDVIRAFLTSCIGDHKEMIKACRCMVEQFQATMPLEEFVTFSKMEDATQDRRFTTVANNCIGPQEK